MRTTPKKSTPTAAPQASAPTDAERPSVVRASVRAAVAPRRDELSMNIYAAMLGEPPAIRAGGAATRPRLNIRVRVEARLEHAGASPFRRPTLLEHVERCAAYAVRAIDEARDRLAAARSGPIGPLAAPPAEVGGPTPIVLIGPAARRGAPFDLSRAA